MQKQSLSQNCIVINSRKQPPLFRIQNRTIQVSPQSIVLKNLYFSVDPVMKFFLAGTQTYFHAVKVGQIMNCFAIGVVMQGNTQEGYQKGDFVFGNLGTCDYIILDQQRRRQCFVVDKSIVNMYGVDKFLYLINNGLAAYAGYQIMQPKQGENVVVSTASGATGILLCQLLKKKNVKVIGLTSQHKISLLQPHVYKTVDYKNKSELLKTLKQVKFSYYFDNVGQYLLDYILQCIQPFGKIALCGAIANYNNYQDRGIKNYGLIISKRIKVEGLAFMSLMSRAQQIFKQYQGVNMNIIQIKMEQFQHYFTQLLKSANNIIGKVIVKL